MRSFKERQAVKLLNIQADITDSGASVKVNQLKTKRSARIFLSCVVNGARTGKTHTHS